MFNDTKEMQSSLPFLSFLKAEVFYQVRSPSCPLPGFPAPKVSNSVCPLRARVLRFAFLAFARMQPPPIEGQFFVSYSNPGERDASAFRLRW